MTWAVPTLPYVHGAFREEEGGGKYLECDVGLGVDGGGVDDVGSNYGGDMTVVMIITVAMSMQVLNV